MLQAFLKLPPTRMIASHSDAIRIHDPQLDHAARILVMHRALGYGVWSRRLVRAMRLDSAMAACSQLRCFAFPPTVLLRITSNTG